MLPSRISTITLPVNAITTTPVPKYNLKVNLLLKRAHNLKNYQIAGPAWIDTEQYDVAAKLPSGTNAEQFRLMLQALLTERFRIQLHSSSKLLMAYRLTIAHGGAKLLPAEKLPQPRVDAKQMMEEMRRNLRERAANEPGHSLSSRSFSHASATTGALAET